MKINGKDYKTEDLDFINVICDLEDVGIDIMGMLGENQKPVTLCRGIISVYTGEKDLRACGRILSEHLKNGGALEDIMSPFMEAMENAGFGKPAEEKIVPLDHKQPKKSAKKRAEEQSDQAE